MMSSFDKTRVAGKKIVWAIDVFEPSKTIFHDTIHTLQPLIHSTGGAIVPVYILNTSELDVPTGVNQLWLENYKMAAEKTLNQTLFSFKADLNFSASHVLVQQTSSLSESVNLLTAFALSIGADLIVVNTHGRSGLKRLFMGSFAEGLLTKSPVPVLVVGPKVEAHPDRPVQSQRSFDQILFPTHFGAHSKRTFRLVVQMALQMKSKLSIFHSIPHPIEPLFQSGVYLLGGTWIPVSSFFSSEIEKQTRRAKVWTRWASQQGVQTEYSIQSYGESIAFSIITLAGERKTGLIVMEHHSDSIAAALLGSITRQVIRMAPCPVWIIPEQWVDRRITSSQLDRDQAAA